MKPESEHHSTGHPSEESGERIPLHRRIRDFLRQEIVEGRRPPMSELPSEKALAETFSTTRMTVRQAIAALEHEGLVDKSQGRRTLVRAPKAVETVLVLQHDFKPDLSNITYKLLHQDVVVASPMVRERLQLSSKSDRVVRFSRIRFMRGVPLSFYTSYFEERYCQGFLERDMTGRSLIDVLRNEYGLVPDMIAHEMEVMTADEEAAELLAVREGTRILRFDSVEYGRNREPLVLHGETYRADIYRFKINVSVLKRD